MRRPILQDLNLKSPCGARPQLDFNVADCSSPETSITACDCPPDFPSCQIVTIRDGLPRCISQPDGHNYHFRFPESTELPSW